MGLFKKTKQPVVNIIQLNEVDGFVSHAFEELPVHSSFLKIKENFDYETSKLKSYANLLLGPDFEKRITQDKDYLKKSAVKANTLINNFLDKIKLPKSISGLVDFVSNSIETIEDFDNYISVPLNHLSEVMPKLIHRIKLKIDAISEVFASFNRFIDSDYMKIIKNVSDLINEYHSLKKKIAYLKEQRVPILDELTQVSMMKDRVEARLESFKTKRSMPGLSELMIEKDKIKEDLSKTSSIIQVNLSYINELVESKEYSNIKDWIMRFISDKDELLTNDHFAEIKDKLSSLSNINNDKLRKIINLVFSSEDKIKNLNAKLKEVNSKLHDNILYLNVKEQEDSYNLWNSKFKKLKSKIREIDNTLSDISLSLVMQNINKEVQKLAPNTIVE